MLPSDAAVTCLSQLAGQLTTPTFCGEVENPVMDSEELFRCTDHSLWRNEELRKLKAIICVQASDVFVAMIFLVK